MDHSAACDIENGFGRRGTASIKAVGRGLALALVMAGSIAASCGAFAAGAAPHPKLVASDIAGRWTGNHYGYGTQRTKCGDKPCSITVDISACASGWCGVMVKDDGECGAAAMTIEASESKHEALRFKGKLELTAGAAPFVIQATVLFEGCGSRSWIVE